MNRIEIILRKIERPYLYGLLMDYFSSEVSPDYPVCVFFEIQTKLSKDPKFIEATPYNFRVVEILDTDNYSVHELAKIVIQPYPTHTVMFFQAETMLEDNIDTADWAKVLNLVHKIVRKLIQFDIVVITTEPQDILTQNMPGSISPLECIEDGRDRVIIDLWLKGLTNTEIAAEISDKYSKIQPITVTNIISHLRKKYGEDVIPKKNERDRRLREASK